MNADQLHRICVYPRSSAVNFLYFYLGYYNIIFSLYLYNHYAKLSLKLFGKNHPDIANILKNLADPLHKTNREAEKNEMEEDTGRGN